MDKYIENKEYEKAFYDAVSFGTGFVNVKDGSAQHIPLRKIYKKKWFDIESNAFAITLLVLMTGILVAAAISIYIITGG